MLYPQGVHFAELFSGESFCLARQHSLKINTLLQPILCLCAIQASFRSHVGSIHLEFFICFLLCLARAISYLVTT